MRWFVFLIGASLGLIIMWFLETARRRRLDEAAKPSEAGAIELKPSAAAGSAPDAGTGYSVTSAPAAASQAAPISAAFAAPAEASPATGEPAPADAEPRGAETPPSEPQGEATLADFGEPPAGPDVGEDAVEEPHERGAIAAGFMGFDKVDPNYVPPADDLEIIEGIGPKIKALLQEHGVRTFADLAAADEDRLRSILRAGGSRFAISNPASWPEQGRLAAAGAWDELKLYQADLRGGLQKK